MPSGSKQSWGTFLVYCGRHDWQEGGSEMLEGLSPGNHNMVHELNQTDNRSNFLSFTRSVQSTKRTDVKEVGTSIADVVFKVGGHWQC